MAACSARARDRSHPQWQSPHAPKSSPGSPAETGYAARQLEQIASYTVAPGYLYHTTHVVLAASVRVTNSEREILRDDRVMPIDNSNFERDFFPRPPENEVSGEIVALLDAISKSGAFQTIAINLGSRDGVESGNLLRIRRNGSVIGDKAEPDPNFTIRLPDEKIGMAMVVRSFEKMSYALIMEAAMPISVNDYVESP